MPTLDSNCFLQTAAPTIAPAYLHWYRLDKLLFNVIFSSVSENVMLLIAMSDTSREGWSTLNLLFVNRSRIWVIYLKDAFPLNRRKTRSISKFLQSIRVMADELALIDTPLTNDDLTLYVLNGDVDYRDIVAPI